MYLKKEYQNATVTVKIKNRSITVDTSLLSDDDKKRLSKNENFAFLFQIEEPEEVEQEREIFPEFTKSELQAMDLHELKAIYPFTFENTKGKLIKEIISLNYGNPERENKEEEEGVL
jgi:hypothetical protein